MTTDYGKRLKQARAYADLTQKQLAKKADTPLSTLASAESEGLGSSETSKWADACGVSASWLTTGKGEMKISKTQEIDFENNIDFPSIKKVNLKVSAGITGFGVEPCTEDDTLIVFRADWYQSRRLKPDNLLALKVSGASMEPNLYDGDVVVMNRADTDLKDGEVFVFNLDGEVVIKRAVRDGGQWWLDSDNQDKTRFTRKACPEGVCIPLGRVIHRQTERI